MAGPAPRTHHFVATDTDEGVRLDQFLAARLPDVSRSRFQHLIREGHVTVSRGRPKPALAVEADLEIEVVVPPATPAEPDAEDLPLDIVHDDDDLVVVNKPAGMVVHPAAGHARGTLVNALLHHVRGLSGVGGAERPGIVHRLDRGTSGLMVVAKHDRAHHQLSRQFQNRRVEKEYLALVWGTVKPGRTLDTPIGRDTRHRTRISSRSRHRRPAMTEVVEAEPLGGVTLARLRIATGRTHQIRVHLSEAGHPVVGDRLYGGIRKTVPGRLAPAARLDEPFLHAARLAFTHPSTGDPIAFEAPLPERLRTVIEQLRTSSRRGLGQTSHAGPEDPAST
jgi:23S rRNA pseudouridine1911/1915/1917 synthase